MSKATPQLQKYMSTLPHSIGSDQPMRMAMEMMKKHSIRHLPVLKGGTLSGILTDRDIKLASGIRGVDPEKTKVEELATEEIYVTSPDSPIDEVVSRMADRKIGSAVVVQNHKLVGIFTTSDALRVLGELFNNGRL
jgi:acetoin utilization protein AcuB